MIVRLFRQIGLWGLVLTLFASSALAESVPRMSTHELQQRLGEADLVVLDARSPYDYARDKTRIVGSIRVDPQNTAAWVDQFDKEQTLVLYCA